jgi:hypothetical protein
MSSSSSACCGQGMTNMMSQFKTATTSFSSTNTKPHPHNSTTQISPQIQTTQITPQTFSNTFTRGGFMKFTRPTKQ